MHTQVWSNDVYATWLSLSTDSPHPLHNLGQSNESGATTFAKSHKPAYTTRALAREPMLSNQPTNRHYHIITLKTKKKATIQRRRIKKTIFTKSSLRAVDSRSVILQVMYNGSQIRHGFASPSSRINKSEFLHMKIQLKTKTWNFKWKKKRSKK